MHHPIAPEKRSFRIHRVENPALAATHAPAGSPRYRTAWWETYDRYVRSQIRRLRVFTDHIRIIQGMVSPWWRNHCRYYILKQIAAFEIPYDTGLPVGSNSLASALVAV